VIKKKTNYCEMKFILFLIASAIVSVAFAGIGDSVSDFVSTFKDATKDHVSNIDAIFPF